MKKLFLSSLMILAITLTACSSASTGTPINSNSSLPIETQLAVGTLKLAGTDQDVTADQAKNLVVYWQVYKELSQSQTAAQAEIDGLIAQIQETMTADQISAIAEMNITQQDVLASTQGVSVTSSGSSSTVSVPSSSSNGGGMPAGGPPSDGGGAPPDGGMSPEISGAASTSGTSQTQSVQTSSGASVTASVPSALVEAVIQSLQKKIAA